MTLTRRQAWVRMFAQRDETEQPLPRPASSFLPLPPHGGRRSIKGKAPDEVGDLDPTSEANGRILEKRGLTNKLLKN